ncbi:SDR family oxidoreductase [Mycobacterium sp. 1081908.1]|uniref:SDR family NAD(P)-dependent oxidoreductase n=1 Tax=Mycobacterium sp. 1081908.1 TaxID=1834066 RepID=UPI00080055B4|nr:SDR family NAD(P)-dependent oxidoreductase [Mycobacterium sp. 1081908.1]OBK52034.1 short-chain dehydrogenase [Mycobacterium sp. 1081908.1]
MSFAGRVAFVTGGASGIGAALATKLVDGGADVWIADRQIDAARALAQRLATGAGKAHAIELDVRDYPAFERAAGEAVRQSGQIDYLFNNAGIGVGGEVDSYTLDDWNDVLDVNLHGVVHGIQAVYPIMIRQRSGHIVNTASMAGLLASPGAVSYTGASDEALLKFWEPMRPLPPEKFAERVLRAVSRNAAIIIVPGWWKALWYLERLSPAISAQAARLSLKRLRAMQHTTR